MSGYSASTENLMNERSQAALQSSDNLYMSLITTPRSSQSALALYRPPTNTGYLNPQSSVSTVATVTSHEHKHRKGKHSHRKDSSSSVSRQTEDIRHSYKKLQICFIVLSVINVIIVAVFVFTYPKFGPLYSDGNDDFTETGDGQFKSFKLCTKCQPLAAKVGFADLIDNIRSTKYPDFCCFRRVDQLLALFDGYAEKYVDQEVFKVRQEMKYNISRHVGRAVSNQSLSLAHVYYSLPEQTASHYGTSVLTWETKGIDILLVGNMKILNRQQLEIPQNGYYYIYSHLQLKTGCQTTHMIMKNVNYEVTKKKLLIQKVDHDSNVLVSELQGVFHLDKGDTLTVLASQKGIKSGERGNYFGAFLLQQ